MKKTSRFPFHILLAFFLASMLCAPPAFFNAMPVHARTVSRNCLIWEPVFKCRHDPGAGYAPPSISGSLQCLQPGDNGWCRDGLSLKLTASDPQHFLVVITGSIAGQAFACPVGNNSCVVPVTSPGAGVALYSVLSEADLSASGSKNYKLDSSAPQIVEHVSGTSGGGGWYVSAVTLDAGFTDAVSGVASTTMLVDGNVTPLPATLGADDEYVVILNARDAAGNLASQSFEVKIDQTPPTVDVVRDATLGANGWYRSEVAYRLDAADSASGVAYGEYRVDGGAWKMGMDFTVSGDGTRTLEYRVFDNAGNVASQSETIHIDTTPPSVSFLSPSANTPVDKTVTVTGTSSDLTSGLEAVEVSVDSGASWTSVLNGDWRYDWKVSALGNGSRDILVRARDAAGNQSSASSLYLRVDNEGPVISLSEPWGFDEAGELVVSSNGYDVGWVSVSISNGDGEVMTSYRRAGVENPSVIWWDGRRGGELQPPGEYLVSVTACDIHGVCSMAKSAIVIPDFYYVFRDKLPEEPKAAVTPPPTEVEVLPPAPVVVESPKPIEVPMPKHPHDVWALSLFVGLGLLFFSHSLLDPRPKALRKLADTLRKQVRVE